MNKNIDNKDNFILVKGKCKLCTLKSEQQSIAITSGDKTMPLVIKFNKNTGRYEMQDIWRQQDIVKIRRTTEMIDSICNECVSRCYIPERIAIDPADSYPAEEWCEEESDNFQTEDGCFRFRRRRDYES